MIGDNPKIGIDVRSLYHSNLQYFPMPEIEHDIFWHVIYRDDGTTAESVQVIDLWPTYTGEAPSFVMTDD